MDDVISSTNNKTVMFAYHHDTRSHAQKPHSTLVKSTEQDTELDQQYIIESHTKYEEKTCDCGWLKNERHLFVHTVKLM